MTSVDFEQNAVIAYKQKLRNKHDRQQQWIFKLINKIDPANDLVEEEEEDEDDENISRRLSEFNYFFKSTETRYLTSFLGKACSYSAHLA